MKTALVHEWLVNYMGSEKCLESFVNIYPDSEVFTLFDFLDEFDRNIILKGKKPSTSFIQDLPFSESKRTSYLPFYPFAIEQFDLSNFDVILSSSHSVAKGVLTGCDQLHICYCHTPIRYAWDLYHQYIKSTGLNKGLKGLIAKYILHRIRLWDSSTSNRVNYFIANSKYIARRIKKIYNRDADVIYPPVDVDRFNICNAKDNYYIAISRFVPYKKIDTIVKAFSQMPEKRLLVIGDGPDKKKIKSLASKNIDLIGHQKTEELKKYLEHSKALIFAAEEDFGITVVESLAAGTPVIALNRGGTAETVKDGINGIHFDMQTEKSIIAAVKRFENLENELHPEIVRETSLQYSRSNFERNIKEYVENKANLFFK